MTVWAPETVYPIAGILIAFHLGWLWGEYRHERRGQNRSLRQVWRDWRSTERQS